MILKVQNHILLHYNLNESKYLQILDLYGLHLLHEGSRASKELCIKFWEDVIQKNQFYVSGFHSDQYPQTPSQCK